MSPEIEIQIIASVVAAPCALVGVFLVLRRLALMSDAISHSILLGIVLAFFVTEDTASPLLIAAAAATGVLTVSLVELLNRTGLVKEDASIGVVFPLLFSIGVILITRYAGDVHLDVDAVLLGELAFAPFDRFEIGGYDLGPRILLVMIVILLLNVCFISLFYKELKLAAFDALLAGALGFAPGLLHYLFMTLVSVTAVGAFDATGSILVVALMIAPPAAAYLLTERLPIMLVLSVLIGVASAIGGYWMARVLDASIAGSMATIAGLLFAFVWAFAPRRGLFALAARRRRQKREFAETMLAVHLLNHEGSPQARTENSVEHLGEHLNWSGQRAREIVGGAERRRLVVRDADGGLMLTENGREIAREVYGGG